ncbi:hypothetical protein EUTSA_v10020932mg [Eutrema salsugineum]|uniref:F-box domain-containing protein n=2 Tax=Eutrema salsugineum TaxID=72664 RepID=V4LWZ7_EUTSA|nr:hypothetical protein EUTSA_v10020932mg [Eutrema salsugineum]
MTNLPRVLLEDILSRVPMTSMRAVRCTCKKWNTLSKNDNFTKLQFTQAAAGARECEFLAIVTMNCSLYLMNINLHGVYNDYDPSIRLTGTVITLDDSDRVVISRICHCEGLLLCTTEAYTSLAVWNPYSGQTRWIGVESTSVHHIKLWYSHALGYEKGKSCRIHKILRFARLDSERSVHEIYDFNSDSWRVLDVTPDWDVKYESHGLSLKGNTYWYATDKRLGDRFLLCFDFTRERFVPRLSLPFRSSSDDVVTLSSVREEQLAVLYQNCHTFEMVVWVTTKIDPNALSWSLFLVVDMRPLSGFRFYTGGSFLIDEEKTVVVVFDEDKNVNKPTRNTAYIIGENDYYREVDIGKITTGKEGFPHACSYVPSSVQINQPA